jgi:hypothetical protein
MRSLVIIASVAALTAIPSSVASAANVTDVQGQVQLSTAGGPFKSITVPTVCNTGDVVRVVKDGSAQVVNANGAIETVSPGKPVVCKAAPAAVAQTPAASTPAASTAAAGSAAGGASTAVVVGGTIAVVAGVAGVVALTKKKSSASP